MSLADSSYHLTLVSERIGKNDFVIYLNLSSFPEEATRKLYEGLAKFRESIQNTRHQQEDVDVSACDNSNRIKDPFLDLSIQRLVNSNMFYMIYFNLLSKKSNSDIIFDDKGYFHCNAPKLTIYHEDIGNKCVSVSRRGVTYTLKHKKCHQTLDFDKREYCVFASASEHKGIVTVVLQKINKRDDDDQDSEANSSIDDIGMIFTLCSLDIAKLGYGQDFAALNRLFNIEGRESCVMCPGQSKSMSIASLISHKITVLIIQKSKSNVKEYFDVSRMDRLFTKGSKTSKTLSSIILIDISDNTENKMIKQIRASIKLTSNSKNQSGDEKPGRKKYSQDDSSDISKEFDPNEFAIPHYNLSQNNIFALTIGGKDEITFSIYWLEYLNDKLHPVAKHDSLHMHLSHLDKSVSVESDIKSMNLSYLEAVSNLVEKIAWIDHHGIPGVALLRLDMTIDLFFFQRRKIVK